MPIPQTPRPDIVLTFRGLMVLSFARNCEVGILLNTPGQHLLTIDVTRGTKDGAPEFIDRIDGPHIKRQLKLEVSKSHPRVMPFRNSGDINDFGLTVDFDELYKNGPPIDVADAGFISFMDINDGLFFTERQSMDLLQTGAGDNPQFQNFGKVAVRIGAHIYLDEDGSTASFKHGGAEIFKAEHGEDLTYGIDVSLSRYGPHPHDARDAEYYYTAIGVQIPPQQKIHFKSTAHMNHKRRAAASGIPKYMFIDPQAVCFTSVLSQTPISSRRPARR